MDGTGAVLTMVIVVNINIAFLLVINSKEKVLALNYKCKMILRRESTSKEINY
jgi:hypothetical protein